MKTLADTRTLMLGVAFLLFLWLLISPRSPSSQSSFSLALDLDGSPDNQAVSSLDVLPGQVLSVQIFGVDMQNASSIATYIAYDTTQVVYVGFDTGSILPNAHALVAQDSGSVRIEVSSLTGSATTNAGLVGVVHFRTATRFTDTEIWLVRAELARGGQSEAISLELGVTLQVTVPPSPDFDGNGVVGFSDLVAFAGGFGGRQGDGNFDARYDLNSDGGVGFDDFVIFARHFGETVNRAPVFAATPPVTRSVEENTPAGQPIGNPITATDAEGDSLAYGLRGVHADSFSIVAGTGQLLTKEGIAYDHETKDAYSVTVRVVDGQGGRATVVVGIAVSDVNEPPAAPPPGVVVTPRDSELAVRWNVVGDQAGKPPVSGYETSYRQGDGDAGDWGDGKIIEGRLDTSVALTGLTNEQTYQVRVRTLNDEGASEWSEPVSGAPTAGPEAVGVISEQNLVAGGDNAPVNMADAFTRPGVGVLTYTAESSDEAIANVTLSDSIATVRPVGTGRATITIAASDAYGNTAHTTFTVVVGSSPPPPPPPPPPGPGGPIPPATSAATSTAATSTGYSQRLQPHGTGTRCDRCGGWRKHLWRRHSCPSVGNNRTSSE